MNSSQSTAVNQTMEYNRPLCMHNAQNIFVLFEVEMVTNQQRSTFLELLKLFMGPSINRGTENSQRHMGCRFGRLCETYTAHCHH